MRPRYAEQLVARERVRTLAPQRLTSRLKAEREKSIYPDQSRRHTGMTTLGGAVNFKSIGGVAAAFVVGLGVGGAAMDRSDELNALKKDRAEQVSALEGEVKEAEKTASAAQDRADEAEESARTAEARAERAAKRKLAKREHQLERRAGELDDREAQVTGLEEAWEEGTVPGDGRFRVGSDIQPGVYQAEASGTGNCYWARLSSDTGDIGEIINNGNTSGPVTITVGAGDAMLELSGCSEFHKVG